MQVKILSKTVSTSLDSARKIHVHMIERPENIFPYIGIHLFPLQVSNDFFYFFTP